MYPWSKRINICTYYWNRNHANTLTIKALGCHERWRPCISWQVRLCSFYLLRHTKICNLMDTHFSQPCNEHHTLKKQHRGCTYMYMNSMTCTCIIHWKCNIYKHVACRVYIINNLHTLTLKLSSSSRFIGLMSLCMTCWECTMCVHVWAKSCTEQQEENKTNWRHSQSEIWYSNTQGRENI